MSKYSLTLPLWLSGHSIFHNDITTENIMTDSRTRLKDNLIIVATVINIVLAIGVIFGGMKWITEIDSSVRVLQDGQKINADSIKELQKWKSDVDQRLTIHETLDDSRFKKSGVIR